MPVVLLVCHLLVRPVPSEADVAGAMSHGCVRGRQPRYTGLIGLLVFVSLVGAVRMVDELGASTVGVQSGGSV